MTGTRLIVRIMDLADDPVAWAQYDAAHAPGNTPQPVLDAQRRHGIVDMEIHRAGNRLVMLMHVTDAYDPDALDHESDPAIADWHCRMGALQRPPLADGMSWPVTTCVFRQSEHP